ncbi:unnamed protein product [Rotaria sp. Silwood2]|nr:unnamed protein product [Rotaria sp. Silwood2]CAF4118869.1 unnamed protein product [Rotaria sp. Silwood2]
MLYRLNFLMRVLHAGYHFLSADMDSIWLSNPFKYISHDKSITIQGQTHKKKKLSGGFVLVHATREGRRFWREIILCQQQNLARIRAEKGRKRIISDFTEQECINNRLRTVKVKLLDPDLFPDGRSFFNQQLPQRRGIVPVVIHGNWIIGLDAKVQRFRAWDLLASMNSSCELVDNGIPYHRSKQKAPIRLRIRVLAYNRLHSLQRLLESLQAADYLGDSVALDISIDRPSTQATKEEKQVWEKVVAYLGHGDENASNFR